MSKPLHTIFSPLEKKKNKKKTQCWPSSNKSSSFISPKKNSLAVCACRRQSGARSKWQQRERLWNSQFGCFRKYFLSFWLTVQRCVCKWRKEHQNLFCMLYSASTMPPSESWNIYAPTQHAAPANIHLRNVEQGKKWDEIKIKIKTFCTAFIHDGEKTESNKMLIVRCKQEMKNKQKEVNLRSQILGATGNHKFCYNNNNKKKQIGTQKIQTVKMCKWKYWHTVLEMIEWT